MKRTVILGFFILGFLVNCRVINPSLPMSVKPAAEAPLPPTSQPRLLFEMYAELDSPTYGAPTLDYETAPTLPLFVPKCTKVQVWEETSIERFGWIRIHHSEPIWVPIFRFQMGYPHVCPPKYPMPMLSA